MKKTKAAMPHVGVLIKTFILLMSVVSLAACSSDKYNEDDVIDYSHNFVGTWAAKIDSERLFYYQFNSDGTGYFWITENGTVDEFGKEPIKWSVNGLMLKVTNNSGVTIYSCTFHDDYLNMTDLDGDIMYQKQ